MVDGHTLNGDFVSLKYVVQLVTVEGASPGLVEKVPFGRKDDNFIVSNDHNVSPQENGLRCNFWDDCCTWVDGKSINRYILRSTMTEIFKRDGTYCKRKKVEKKCMCVELSPQSSEADIIIVHAFYCKLKRKTDYARRVTWMSDPHVALYEYKGTILLKCLFMAVRQKPVTNTFEQIHR